MKWILFVATIISLYMTLDTLRVIDWLKQNSPRLKKLIWGDSFKSIPKSSQTMLENKMVIWGTFIPLATTFALARATYMAFFE